MKESPQVALRFRSLLVVVAMTSLALVGGGANGQPANGQQAPWAGLSGGIPSGPGPARITLPKTGSTLLYPLSGSWASAYHQRYPNVSISTAATGSGTGIKDASAVPAMPAEVTGSGTSAARFATLEADLSRAITADQVAFRSSATAGRDVFGGLEIGVILAALAIAAGSAWGLSRRLTEYR